jgi:large subunit ribosomal protein L10
MKMEKEIKSEENSKGKEESKKKKNPAVETKVSKKKIETVKKIVELMNSNDTLIIASIKNLPSRQFQDIRKRLRGKAEVKVIKKRIMLKAIETSENKKLEELKKYVQEDSAILFSSQDTFDLVGFLAENKNPIKAKVGQVAIEDIEVEEGPTDLIPGPAISEFGNLGIKIAVEEGKIAIKEKKVIAKKDEKISGSAASIMSKLDIKPFKIGLEPLAIYDDKTGKIYTDVKIDKEKAVEDLKISSVKALGLAQKIIYYCKETIGFLLAKANSEKKSLNKLQPEKKVEEKKEEGKEKVEEKSEEQKEETAKQEENKNTDEKIEENKDNVPQENKQTQEEK